MRQSTIVATVIPVAASTADHVKASRGPIRPAAMGRKRFVGCRRSLSRSLRSFTMYSAPETAQKHSAVMKARSSKWSQVSNSSGNQSWLTEKISAMKTMPFLLH